ncbi:hypothetical protein MHBO_003028 [Bonamia ostreae]|uniref:Uncharacterized protein n=1 Tax=Bonamia ostreae TaxID=126728 RepID=A0ABV2APB1_9EUKA
MWYDGKSSWKSFLRKIVRLARSQQLPEFDQRDHFFSLEGAASNDYMLLERDDNLSLSGILRCFEKSCESSVLDFTHRMNFQSASQNMGESLHHCVEWVLTLAIHAFP